MFHWNTQKVQEYLEDALNACSNSKRVVEGLVGQCNIIVINRLFCAFKKNQRVKFTIVSAFGAGELASRLGPNLVVEFANVLNVKTNASLCGWLFEIWVFANIKIGLKIKIYEKDVFTMSWTGADCHLFDPDIILTQELEHQIMHGFWLKPIKWHQAGYDAVYIKSTKVSFFQFTSGATHTYKIKYFNHLLANLKKLHIFQNKILTSRTYFVTPEQNIATLTIISKSKNYKIAGMGGFTF